MSKLTADEKKKVLMRNLKTPRGRLNLVAVIRRRASELKLTGFTHLTEEDIKHYLDYLIYQYKGNVGDYIVDKVSEELLPLASFLEKCKQFTSHKPDDYDNFFYYVRRMGGA